MKTQWYLCEIEGYPDNERKRLKITDNLSVTHPEKFFNEIYALLTGGSIIEDNKEGEGQWYVWLPIIPRVGDTLQFAGWQVQVSNVVLSTDWRSETGIQEGIFVVLRNQVTQIKKPILGRKLADKIN